MEESELVLYVNGRRIVPSLHPTDSVADLLHHLGLRGTKVVCEQGGCGACSVILTYWDPRCKEFKHRTVNSCLVPLVYANHTAILTVEGLGTTLNPHPIQRLIAENNGSQCGYCTPGFVIAMYGKLLNKEADESMIHSIASNLCRCTGYRPIAETAKMIEAMDMKVEYPYELPDELKVDHLRYVFDVSKLSLPSFVDRASYIASTTDLRDALTLLKNDPQLRVSGGFSELLVVRSDHNARAKENNTSRYLSTWRIWELIHVKEEEDGVHIGSCTTINQIKREIKKSPSLMKNPRMAELAKVYTRFASPQVRNCATIGGNVCHGSPVSDTLPVLLSSEAIFVAVSLKDGSDQYQFRYIKAADWMKGYLRNGLQQGEMLYEIIIPKSTKTSFDTIEPSENGKCNIIKKSEAVNNFFIRSYKLSRRYDDDIAVVGGCLEVAYENVSNGLKIKRFRTSYSAMAATTVRFMELEDFVESNCNIISRNPEVFENTLTKICDVVAKKYTLSKNVPGGLAMYRSSMAKNIVVKFLLESLKDCNFKFNNETLDDVVLDGSYHCIPDGVETCSQYYEGKEEYESTKKENDSKYKELRERKVSSKFGTVEKEIRDTNNADPFGKPVVHQSALQQATGEANYLSTMKEVFNNNFDNNLLNQKINASLYNSNSTNSCLFMYPIYAATTYGKIRNIEEVKNYYNNRYSCNNPKYNNTGYFRILTAADVPNYLNKNMNKNTSTRTTAKENVGINRVGVSGFRDEPVLMTNGDDILAPSEMIAIVVCETMRSAKKIAAEIKANTIFTKTKEELDALIHPAVTDNEEDQHKRLVIDISNFEQDKQQGNIVTNIADFISLMKQSESPDAESMSTSSGSSELVREDLIKKHVLCVKDLYFSENNKYKDNLGADLKLSDMKAQTNLDSSIEQNDFRRLFDVTGMKVYRENDSVYTSKNGPRTEESYRIYYSEGGNNNNNGSNAEDPYFIIESTLSLQHQEHFYFETHCTLANVENAHISNTSVADDMAERDLINAEGKSGECIEEPKVTLSLTTTTQNISGVTNNVSAALSIPASRIVVNICNNRIGGGFGGKESTFQQQTACALASLRSNSDGSDFDREHHLTYQYRPVYTQNSRADDLKYTGKRHPFTFYNLARVNLRTMKIEALQVVLYSDAGYVMDLSGSVMERAVFHATNSYYVPNIKVVGNVIRTRANSNTAFRGFGAPQAVMNIEMLVERMDKFKRWYWSNNSNNSNECSSHSSPLSLNTRVVNMLHNGNILPYGGAVFGVTLQRMLNTPFASNNQKYPVDRDLDAQDDINNEQPDTKKTPEEETQAETGLSMNTRELYTRNAPKIYNDRNSMLRQYSAMRHSYAEYNRTHKLTKRGVGLVPLTFGITFTQRFLNQCSAIVTLHKDGSFAVSHCGIEMGQGIDTKMRQLAAKELCCDYSKVTIQQSSSSLLPNGPPTSASSAADLNGYAIINAVKQLRKELNPIIDEVGRDPKHPELINWPRVAGTAFMRRAVMSFVGHYSSPCKGYDFATHQGTPFGYYSFSSALVGVEVDVLTGEYKCLRGAVCVDVGASTNHTIDIGQIEGAFVQGLGYVYEDFILLDVMNRDTGERVDRIPLSSGPGNYKIPSILDIPESFSVSILAGSRNPKAPHSGKGVGEPPLCLGAALMVALQDAVDSCYEGAECGSPQLTHPCTMESVRDALPSAERLVASVAK